MIYIIGSQLKGHLKLFSIITIKRRCIYKRTTEFDLVKDIKSLRKYLKKMKPTDEYVRGYNDAKSIIDEVLNQVEEILIDMFYCQSCQKKDGEHIIPHSMGGEHWDDRLCDDCIVHQPEWVLNWYNKIHNTNFKQEK